MWQQTEGGDLHIAAGDAVAINRGLLGACRLSPHPGAPGCQGPANSITRNHRVSNTRENVQLHLKIPAGLSRHDGHPADHHPQLELVRKIAVIDARRRRVSQHNTCTAAVAFSLQMFSTVSDCAVVLRAPENSYTAGKRPGTKSEVFVAQAAQLE